jgi:hypothetical protein
MSTQIILTDDQCEALIKELSFYFGDDYSKEVFKQKGIGHLKDTIRLWHSEIEPDIK